MCYYIYQYGITLSEKTLHEHHENVSWYQIPETSTPPNERNWFSHLYYINLQQNYVIKLH